MNGATTGGLLLVLATAALAGAAPPGTPAETYRAYRQAFDQAKAFDELWPFMDKATLARAKTAPPKGLSDVRNVQVVKETVTGDRAVLEAAGDNAGTGNRSRATVKLVKEDGAWKIQQESWAGSDSKP
jgi:hypothetical protein